MSCSCKVTVFFVFVSFRLPFLVSSNQSFSVPFCHYNLTFTLFLSFLLYSPSIFFSITCTSFSWFPVFSRLSNGFLLFCHLTLLPPPLSFSPLSPVFFLPLRSLLQWDVWIYFSCRGLPCMASLHSNANNAGQLWLSMRLCLCLQEHIQRHIVSGEIWVSQRSIPSGTASGR